MRSIDGAARRWAAVLTACTLGLAALAGCGSGDGEESSDGGSTAAATAQSAAGGEALAGKRIAFVQPGPNEYYDYSKQGAEAAIERLGGEAVVYNSHFDPQK